jgi:two-component system sensor histidine kinase ArlS
MKIRTRLTLLFTLITATVFLFFSFLIYWSAKENREKEFFALLNTEALTKAKLFFDANVPAETLQTIYRNNREMLNEVEVAIFDLDFNLLYHDAVELDFVHETPDLLNQILTDGVLFMYQDDWQIIGLRYRYLQHDFLITAAAYDQYGYRKLKSLMQNLSVFLIGSLLFLFVAGYFFSKKALEPVKNMVFRAKSISLSRMGLRLEKPNSKDELAELANTFNEMLDRLENSFDAQKNFVSNISHELRTPLAAMIAEIELAKEKKLSNPELQEVFNNTLADARKMVKLSDSLLDLARATFDASQITFKPLRLDEILLDAQRQVQLLNKEYSIDIHFEDSMAHENDVMILGNEYLIRVACINLMENACKFSPDQQGIVSISSFKSGAHENQVWISFSDRGPGIPEDERDEIFKPFYRGKHPNTIRGNGIGLSLTLKIIQLHSGHIVLKSTQGKGSTFTLIFPGLKQ